MIIQSDVTFKNCSKLNEKKQISFVQKEKEGKDFINVKHL